MEHCPRCNIPLTEQDSFKGYCSRLHRKEALQQLQSLREAGAGCGRCYRGAVFFVWRLEGGRQRIASLNLAHQHAAPCTCPAGQRLTLPGGYKTWGFMRDVGPAGEDERRGVLG